MLVRLYLPNCDFQNGNCESISSDCYWVEATKEEAHNYIFPYLSQKEVEKSKVLASQGEYIAQDLGNPSRPFCFLVAKDLRSIDPFKADYPFHQLWNGYSPFEGLSEIFDIETLAELAKLTTLQ